MAPPIMPVPFLPRRTARASDLGACDLSSPLPHVGIHTDAVVLTFPCSVIV
jgi:hypothetical protein